MLMTGLILGLVLGAGVSSLFYGFRRRSGSIRVVADRSSKNPRFAVHLEDGRGNLLARSVGSAATRCQAERTALRLLAASRNVRIVER